MITPSQLRSAAQFADIEGGRKMTDTKPTIDEQSLAYRFWEFLATSGNEPSALDREILDFLRRTQSAEMPVEPVIIRRMRDPLWCGIEPSELLAYIDALQAYAQRKEAVALSKQAAIDMLNRMNDQLEQEKAALIAQLSDAVHLNDEQALRVYKAERERDALRKDAERYRWITEMWPLEITRLVHSFTVDATSVDVHKAIDNAMDEGRG
jgi:hypothetical protein